MSEGAVTPTIWTAAASPHVLPLLDLRAPLPDLERARAHVRAVQARTAEACRAYRRRRG